MVEESDLSTLLSSAALVLIGGIVGSASKLVERVVIGRALSPTTYGEVSIGIAVLTFGATFSILGLSQGVPRYMARFDDDRDVRGAWLTGLLVAVPASLVLTGVLLWQADLIATHLFELEASIELLYVLVLSLPFVVGLRIAVGGIRGFENTIYRTYANDLVYPGLRIGLLVVLLYVGFDVVAAGYAYLVAAAVAVAVAHVLLNNLLQLVGPVTLHAREMFVFSAPLAISTVLSVLLTRTDTIMIGYFRPSLEVGLYSAAYPLAQGMLVVLGSFGFVYLPLASRLDADDRRGEIDTIYTLTTKWIYVVTFPAFLAFVAFPADVLGIVFGAEYTDAWLAMMILSVGFFTNAAVGRNRETVSALGHTQYIFYANGIAFVLNVALNLLLIPVYGYHGAALTSAISFIALNATVYLILQRKFDISPLSSSSVRTFLSLPIVGLPIAFALARVVSLSVVTLPLFLVVSGLGCVLVVCIAGGLRSEDRIVLELIEEYVGVRVPFVWRYVPDVSAKN